MKASFKMTNHKDKVSKNLKLIINYLLSNSISSLFDFENLGKFFFSNGKIYEGECKRGKGNGLGNEPDSVNLN